MNGKNQKKISGGLIGLIIVFTCMTGILSSESIKANSSFAEELALAILADPSWLISASYSDTDNPQNRQAIILSSMGIMKPTYGDSFILLSTGIAGAEIATTYEENPGSERGTWFEGGQYPRNRWPYIYDRATLSMTLLVPDDMNYVYYDVQFFSTEYPEYVGSVYNDKFTATVTSPSKGSSSYVIDINTGHFVLDSHDIPGTGFDVFSTIGNPSNVDIVDTTPRTPGADAGATALHTAGGHQVSPNEQITITFEIQDVWDNQFDSTAFIDNLRFAEYARPVIEARKEVESLNERDAQSGDVLKYTITVSNMGVIDQTNNPGNEIEDKIPENTSYVAGSATATSGLVNYDSTSDKIIWNGAIPGESSVVITFMVQVEEFGNQSQIPNQAEINWDKNNDGANDELLLTNWANISTNRPPIVFPIPGQAICDGELFSEILLDDYVYDPDNTKEEINWSIHTARTLWIHLETGRLEPSDPLDWIEIDENRIATISYPDDENQWGRPGPQDEYVPAIDGALFVFKPQFVATDPGGLSDFDSSVGNFTVYPDFDPPTNVTEDFSDDLAGGPASESYLDREWFSTDHSIVGSNFEVSEAFECLTPNSFKTKIRADGSPLYWNYYLDNLSSDITAWEIWVYIGKTSEYSNVLLDFKNSEENTIAMIRLDYDEIGTPPLRYLPRIDCWSGSKWVTLENELDNGWYKLRLDRNEATIDYRLYELLNQEPKLLSNETGSLNQPFKDLSKIEWSSSYDAIVCPMFFWNDHTVYLEPLS